MKITARFFAFLLSLILSLQSFVICSYAEEEEFVEETYESVDESDDGGSGELYADGGETPENDLTEETEDEVFEDSGDILTLSELISEEEETIEVSEEQEEETAEVSKKAEEENANGEIEGLIIEETETQTETESASAAVISGSEEETVSEEITEEETETAVSEEEISAAAETENSGETENNSESLGSSGGGGTANTNQTETVNNARLRVSANAVYTVTLNAGGGTFSNSDWTDNGDGTYYINLDSNGSITLPAADELTKTGYSLAGWSTAEGSTSVVYASGAEIAFEDLSGNLSLWAVWRVGFTATLALNSGKLKSDNWTANTDGTYSTVLYSGTNQYLTHSVTLPTSSELTLSGYKLSGWCKTNSSNTADYLPGDTINYDDLTDSLNLWAVWEIESYTVIFKSVADGDTLWQIDIEYGTALWNDKSVSPWDDDDVVWTYYDENGDEIVSVTTDSDGNIVDGKTGKSPAYGSASIKIYDDDTEKTEITKVFDIQTDNGGDTTIFIYYTFTYENEKWFTAAEGIVPDKNGYTFRDWYMIYPVLDDTLIEDDDTIFIARYIDTGGYVAAVNYRYSSKTIAATSDNIILSYDSYVTGNYVYAKVTANVIDGYVPTLISSSDEGVYLGEYDPNLEVTEYSYTDIVNTEGTEVISQKDGNTYIYYIRIDITETTFTGSDGETVDGTDNATVHYVTFTVVYDPDPAGYRVNYFRELDLAAYNERANASITSGHTNTYELFESDEVTVNYVSSDGSYVWTHTWYTVYTEETWAKVLEDNGYSAVDYPLEVELGKTAVTTTNNEGDSVVYYYYENNSSIAAVLGLTAYYHDYQTDSVEYRTGDTFYPEDITNNSNSYDGYVLGTGSQSIISMGYELVTAYDNNIRSIFYNRADYHVYYITNSDSATIENELYVYGDKVEYPSESDAARQGYTLDTGEGGRG
ncbi:MAG: InlB B-repeat-containing protein [Clostridiales bacterium]|nr:InlB B-repeat-containing protein [Clostridiales bacterium]